MEDKRKCPRVKREKDAIVASKIRQYRNLIGLSQEALAKKLNLTFQQVQKYERGTNRVSAGTLFDIANILEIPVLWFFGEVDDVNDSLTSNLNSSPFMDEEINLIKLYRKSPNAIKGSVLNILECSRHLPQ